MKPKKIQNQTIGCAKGQASTLRIKEYASHFSITMVEKMFQEIEVMAVTRWEVSEVLSKNANTLTIKDFLLYMNIMCSSLTSEARCNRDYYFHLLRKSAPEIFCSAEPQIIN